MTLGDVTRCASPTLQAALFLRNRGDMVRFLAPDQLHAPAAINEAFTYRISGVIEVPEGLRL